MVARGFLQNHGIGLDELYALVARTEKLIRTMVAIASYKGWKMQPPVFEIKGQERNVYRLRKVVYGLNQAPIACNKRIDSFITSSRFTKCISVKRFTYAKSGILCR